MEARTLTVSLTPLLNKRCSGSSILTVRRPCAIWARRMRCMHVFLYIVFAIACRHSSTLLLLQLSRLQYQKSNHIATSTQQIPHCRINTLPNQHIAASTLPATTLLHQIGPASTHCHINTLPHPHSPAAGIQVQICLHLPTPPDGTPHHLHTKLHTRRQRASRERRWRPSPGSGAP